MRRASEGAAVLPPLSADATFARSAMLLVGDGDAALCGGCVAEVGGGGGCGGWVAGAGAGVGAAAAAAADEEDALGGALFNGTTDVVGFFSSILMRLNRCAS